MTRMRMFKSALECDIVPQSQPTPQLTSFISPAKEPSVQIFPRVPRHSARKEPNMPHSSPFLYKSLDQLASNNIHPRSISSTRRFQQCSAQATPLMRGVQYGPPKSIPYARARHPIPRASPPRQKKPPHKRGAAFYKTMRSFNRAWVQPSQAFDQERARREIYSAASSVAGFSALGAAAFFLG